MTFMFQMICIYLEPGMDIQIYIIYSFSTYHGAVEDGLIWKVTTIGDTPMFHWTMIMRRTVHLHTRNIMYYADAVYLGVQTLDHSWEKKRHDFPFFVT